MGGGVNKLDKGPQLGLVCVTAGEAVRFRTITLSRYRSLRRKDREPVLRRLYWDNLARLHAALSFCHRHDIRLYRVPSGLFPTSDEPIGEGVLRAMAANLSSVGRRTERLGIRVVSHPDQFVVLNSTSPAVVRTSVTILEKHALAFDLMGLPRSPWAMILVHGGKAGRAEELVNQVGRLPEAVRSRLCLENDEYAYSAEQVLGACRRAGVPMVFDCHHHVIRESLDSYDHSSVEHFTRAAGETWPDPAWQIVHASNGATAFRDRHHSDLISLMPPAYANAPWIEVEARGKEIAIAALRREWPARAAPDSHPHASAAALDKPRRLRDHASACPAPPPPPPPSRRRPSSENRRRRSPG